MECRYHNYQEAEPLHQVTLTSFSWL